jgi:D-sedoheptulose 7-phosphate isomerase
MSQMSEYLAETARVVQAMDEGRIQEMVDVLEAAFRDGRRIFCCGNGGSGSLASHMAADLNKCCHAVDGPRFKIIPLTDNMPTLLAYANDISYDDAFVEQLINLYEPGDVVLGISGSGNSENVVRTLRWAREHGGTTLGMIGFGGGRMKDLCDVAVIADSHDMQHCEDAHVVLMHLLMQIFLKKVVA